MGSATGRRLLTARLALLLAGVAALGFLAAVALGAPPPDQTAGSPTSTEPNNVKLCHRTGSPAHPWVVIIIRPHQAAPYIRRGDKLPNPDGSCTDSPHPTTTATTTASTTTAPSVKTQPNQVRLCHQTGVPSQPWVPIWVNQPAVASYLLRGDILAWPDGSCPPPPRPAATTTETTTESAPTTAARASVDDTTTQTTTTVETSATVESTTAAVSTTDGETTT
jgi:hypothetical protein